jgi:alkanesulfonate monooxygenase SsuD/methylene tetrahydromethanopterin reductase-like flavin-dependent oxidoreductase (luciferase family)
MDFNHFLSSYFPDPDFGGKQLYADMVEQAVTAERLGFRGVTLPEHHMINILITPAPLQMAVKLACVTERIELVTSVVVLPNHNMRVYAGEVSQADILTDGRLILGVGRGAFPYEMGRLGNPLETARERFDESLDVLMALLSEEEVSWDGKYYKFDPVTVMPRPLTQPMPRMMMAVLNPPGIAACTKRGFHIQTTPLSGDMELFRAQIGAHKDAKVEMGEAGAHLRLMMSRLVYCARDEVDARAKLDLAQDYYSRFDNLHFGHGVVERGRVAPLPRKQSVEELAENIIICPPDEMVDRLAVYAEAGVDEVILNSNIGAPQAETIEAMERFGAEVMPHFRRAVQAAE